VLVISVVMQTLTLPLLDPKLVDQGVVAPDGRVVRVRSLSADQRQSSSSSFASRELVPEMQRIEAAATTGTLATVSDMQSSTSPQMSSEKPPLVTVYPACTRDTIVVTTAA
jgi:hypothetical protein